jgi:putative endonuclease
VHSKSKLGNKAEDAACGYLKELGYEILERNWRFRKAEIDIIAKDPACDILVFLEVKSRSYTSFGYPESAVMEKQQKLITDAAAAYMDEVSYAWAVRYDILGVEFDNKGAALIRHFKDAFLV